MKNILQVKNLHISFKRKRKPPIHIVRGIDLTVKKGQIIGIVGESGSGKSVSSKALMDVNEGDITSFDSLIIGNKKFDNLNKEKRKLLNGKIISYIPQNPMTSMNPSRSIQNHIHDVLTVRKKWDKDFFKGKTFNSITKKILEQFKIDNIEVVLKSYPHELSGGMKQRIIIAMAVLVGAKLIIADEPTTALDAAVQSSVLSLMQDIAKKFDISLIFISHNIAVVAKLCNYIYVMYAGKVLEKAKNEELFTNPKHPYTWALISSISEGKEFQKEKKLYEIPGSPPDMANLLPGDPFASRNQFALSIDFKQEPPLFEVNKDHYAATWLLHPSSKKVEIPSEVIKKINVFKKTFK